MYGLYYFYYQLVYYFLVNFNLFFIKLKIIFYKKILLRENVILFLQKELYNFSYISS